VWTNYWDSGIVAEEENRILTVYTTFELPNAVFNGRTGARK
jgi:hypothetical protein